MDNRPGLTLVFCPLIALAADITYNCRKRNLLVKDWRKLDRQPLLHATRPVVVTISAEDTLDSNFWTRLAELKENGSIQRIVFDECHVFAASRDFCRHMKNVLHILSGSGDIVGIFLTATVPPSKEIDILRPFFGANLNRLPCNLNIIRMPTDCPSIAYKLHWPNTSQDAAVNNLVKDVLRIYSRLVPCKQIIVFTNQIAEVNKLYGLLSQCLNLGKPQIQKCHGKMGNNLKDKV
ncbi:hypothetical protein GGI05_002547, partial [Coemansia sp. RSA 2603]